MVQSVHIVGHFYDYSNIFINKYLHRKHPFLNNAQLSVSQKALGTLPEDDNVMPKHVGDTTHINKLNE
jgi:hypothetical protein